MKKITFSPLFIGFFTFLLISCGSDDLGDVQAESLEIKMLTANIVESDLVGHWDLSMMETDTHVDLNQDGTFNQDLLLETDCFDPMSITFNADKSFSSVNARLDFKAGEGDDEFFCMGNRTDKGTWSVKSDTLSLHVNVNGTIYNDEKKLILKENTFSFEVTELESQKYVADPGDTSVSKVTVVSLEYTKN